MLISDNNILKYCIIPQRDENGIHNPDKFTN